MLNTLLNWLLTFESARRHLISLGWTPPAFDPLGTGGPSEPDDR